MQTTTQPTHQHSHKHHRHAEIAERSEADYKNAGYLADCARREAKAQAKIAEEKAYQLTLIEGHKRWISECIENCHHRIQRKTQESNDHTEYLHTFTLKFQGRIDALLLKSQQLFQQRLDEKIELSTHRHSQKTMEMNRKRDQMRTIRREYFDNEQLRIKYQIEDIQRQLDDNNDIISWNAENLKKEIEEEQDRILRLQTELAELNGQQLPSSISSNSSDLLTLTGSLIE